MFQKLFLSQSVFITLLVLNFGIFLAAQKEEICKIKGGGRGICKKLKYCPELEDGIVGQGGSLPTICRFAGYEPVVCCPVNDSVVSVEHAAPPVRPTPLATVSTPRHHTRWTTISHKTSTITTSTATTISTTAEIATMSEFHGNDDGVIEPQTKSDMMCQIYAQSAYNEKKYPAQLIGQPLQKFKEFTCPKEETLIVGGTKARPKEFPHMALIGYGDSLDEAVWTCGGALISNKYVLSAAHCAETSSGPAKWARLGDLNINSDADDARPENIVITNITKHPEYKQPQLYNDIALFELEREVQFSAYIRPTCLNTDPKLEFTNATATGWGRTSEDGDRSDELLKVVLTTVPHEKCNSSFHRFMGSSTLPTGIIDSIMMCAGEREGGKDTCQGDSGGPLQVSSEIYKCMHVQVGITSFGRRCAAPNSPGVYTKISAFTPWIESIVWP